MLLPIYVYGSSVLRQKAKDITPEYPELQTLITNMYETLDKADGVGLAAPQVGLSIRLFIVDGHLLGEDHPELIEFKRTVINPKIIEHSEEVSVYNEGCLSVPGVYADIERPISVTMEYYNEHFEKKVEKFEGFAARMVQHEYSHLDGELFIDKATPIRKKMSSGKLQEIAKGHNRAHYKTKLVK